MKRIMACALVLATAALADPPSPVGFWHGELEGPAGSLLKVGMTIERNQAGQLGGSLDLPEQGLVGLTFDLLRFTNNRLRFAHKATRLIYDGTLSEDGQTITGTLSQNGLTGALNFRRAQQRLALERPQQPKPPFPYATDDVTIAAPGGVKLGATLTKPAGNGPFVGVVLIAGSGPQDRDETIFGHKPFLLLADQLTRAGLAVLRYDKRGVGQSTGPIATITTADFADDAQAAFDWLRKRPELDAQRVGLLGHSEGGAIAPMIAARVPEVAFCVLLAAPGVPGSDVLRHQGNLAQRKMGADEAAVARIDAAYRRVMALVGSKQDSKSLAGPLRPLVKDLVVAQGAPPRDELVDAALAQLLSPWVRWFAVYDPAPTLQKVRCPVLALFGDLDTQVDPAQNLAPLAAALQAGGNPDFTIIKLPRCNHLFQTARTGLVPEYAQLTETMAPRALTTIVDWVKQR